MTEKQHFKLHFEPDTWLLYEEHNKGYYRKQWKDICRYTAIKRIHYNTSKWKNYIIIDIDNNDIYKYREQNLPEPNFILKNKGKPGGHLFYVLDKGIHENNHFYLEQWRQVFKNFTILSGGDTLAKGYVGKFVNSHHFDYIELETSAYDISYLYSFINHTPSNNQAYNPQATNPYIDTISTKKKPYKANIGQLNLDIIQIGERNDTLFNKIRKYSYIQILILTEKEFKNAVSNYGNELNNSLLAPLPQSEINATIKSIIKYCINNKSAIKNYSTENSKNRGIMNLDDKDITLKEKQRLSADYTNQQRKDKTLFKLKLSIIEMKARELKINNTTLSKYSKISLATVKRYKKNLDF